MVEENPPKDPPKKMSKGSVATLALGTTGLYVYKKVKNFFFGTSIRKSITYTAFIMWAAFNLWGDRIDAAYNKVKTFVDEKQSERIAMLEDSLDIYRTREKFFNRSLSAYRDSVSETSVRILNGKNIAHSLVPEESRFWHVVRPGETLENVAKKYYGDESFYALLSASNDFPGNAALDPGFPLIVPDWNLITTVGLRKDPIPRFKYILQGQEITDLLQNEYVRNYSVSADSFISVVVAYNIGKGNAIPDMKKVKLERAVVYIPE